MSKSKTSELAPNQFQYILDQLPLRVFWKDMESRYLGCNQFFAQDAGLDSPSAVVGKTDFDMPWAACAKVLQEEDHNVISTGNPLESFEAPLNNLHGLPFWLHKRKRPLLNQDGEMIGTLGEYADITEFKKIELEDLKIKRALNLLLEANHVVIEAQDENTLYSDVCRLAAGAGYVMAWIGLAEFDEQKSVRPVSEVGAVEDYLKNVKISWGDNEYGRGPTGTAIRESRTVVNQNFLTNQNMLPWREAALKAGYQASIALPLVDPEVGVIGAFMIYAKEANAFIADEVLLLEELAKSLRFGIRGIRERKKRFEVLIRTVEAIAATIELRDPYTAGHQRQVAKLAVAIAAEMGLDADEIVGIRLASTIHDVGKIGVPAEILSKPTKLSNIEYLLIKAHPELGYEILKEIPFTWPIADMVLQHHERMDGSGYPMGLKGKAINLGARIIAVADLVEAMSSHRPYRAALGIDAAINEISTQRGNQLDAEVVDACIRLFKEKDFRIVDTIR